MAEPMSEGQREPISPERLAQIREECGPGSVYFSGAAGDGLVVMANELLDEIDRLTEVLEASRVVRNAAESSCRVYKAVVDRLKADRTRLRAELDRCAGLNRDLVKENVDATTRADTAVRELAELGRVEYEIGIRQPGEDDAQQYCGFSEADVRARAAEQGATYVERVCRRGEWKAAEDGA